MSRWKAFFNLCWLFGHHHEQVIDCDARRASQRCVKCGHEFQYDFQKQLTPEWIGFCSDGHRCPLCMGWKPRDWDRCGNELCTLNPNGPMRVLPDGNLGFDLDSRNR